MSEIELGQYAILRTQKLKTWGNVSAVLQHNFRLRPTSNANPEGHFEILAGSPNHQKVLDEMRERVSDITVRKNAVLAFELLLTATPSYFRPDPSFAPGEFDEERVDDFRKLANEWAKRYFGEENIVSNALHLDETTPHLQLIIQPIDSRGKLNASAWLDGNKKLSEMQDSFAAFVAPLGLQRGIKGSTASHSKVKRMYTAVTAPLAQEKARPKVPKKWSRIPSWFADLWEYPKMKALHDDASRVHNRAKAKVNEVNSYNSHLRHTNALKANALELAQRKASEARATAQKLAAENESLGSTANRLRAIPLEQVLEHIYGAKLKKAENIQEQQTYHLPDDREVSIKATAKGRVWQAENSNNQRNSINLVMWLDGIDYNGALKLLALEFGESEAIAEHVAVQIERLETEAAELIDETPIPAPKPEPSLWYKVEDWLNKVQSVPLKLAKWLHDENLVYADRSGNAVFKRQNGGAFVEGVDKPFSRTIGNESCGPFVIPGSTQDLYLTESTLDAIAIKSAQPEVTVAAFPFLIKNSEFLGSFFSNYLSINLAATNISIRLKRTFEKFEHLFAKPVESKDIKSPPLATNVDGASIDHELLKGDVVESVTKPLDSIKRG